MHRFKHIKEFNSAHIIPLEEGTETDLAREREIQSGIRDEIGVMKTEIEEIDRGDDSELEKDVEKAKLMKDIASRMIDQARSIELEADLMTKNAKEKEDQEQPQEEQPLEGPV